MILCRRSSLSMFIITHLSRFSNNNVLSSRRYQHIKHLSSPFLLTANKSLKYWVSIFIRIQLPASFNIFFMNFDFCSHAKRNGKEWNFIRILKKFIEMRRINCDTIKDISKDGDDMAMKKVLLYCWLSCFTFSSHFLSFISNGMTLIKWNNMLASISRLYRWISSRLIAHEYSFFSSFSLSPSLLYHHKKEWTKSAFTKHRKSLLKQIANW